MDTFHCICMKISTGQQFCEFSPDFFGERVKLVRYRTNERHNMLAISIEQPLSINFIDFSLNENHQNMTTVK